MGIFVNIINGMTNATDGDLLAVHSDNFVQEGVKNLSTHFAVTEKGSPDMSVDVAAGIAYVENDSWTEFTSDEPRFWRVVNDATVNTAISSNSSGSTRVDLVCIKVNTAISPGDNGELGATIEIVEGTPGAGAPATPANHFKLGQVTVADGATSITNANIADSRVASEILPTTPLGWSKVQETWSYASADAPTFVMTVPAGATAKYSPGMRVKLTQSTGGTKYFIITAVASTSITLYGGTDYTLNNEAITAPYYSTQKAPFGFPLSAAKWSVRVTNTSSASQTASDGVW
jgi:hypothetical protein